MIIPPLLEQHDWSISDDVIDELEMHCGTRLAARPLVLQNFRAALEEFHGYSGRLNRALIDTSITQDFSEISSRNIHLWGGDVSNVSINFRDDGDLNAPLPSSEFTTNRRNIVLSSNGFSRIRDAIEVNSGIPQIRVQYTAGIAEDIDSLPSDLRTALYTIARKRYDYRDDYIPRNLYSSVGTKRVIKKYRIRPFSLLMVI